MPSENVKELYIDEKWDKVIDVSLRRVVYGSLAGGVVGLLLLRGSCSRVAALTFGAGWGAGSAWQSCSKELDDLFAAAVKK